MRCPLYLAPGDLPTPGGHRGLWFDRFFDRYDEGQWKLSDTAKLSWIDSVGQSQGPCGDREALHRQGVETLRLVHALGGKANVFRVQWRFASGLGLDHPVENGFAWHPVLGVPFLTGSAVKGLLRAWMEVWRGEEIEELGWEAWFGTQDEAGTLVFFDAIPTQPVSLVSEVMTPHMGDWYPAGDTISDPLQDHKKVPADWHQPVPVPFLAVEGAAFLFAVAPRRPDPQEGQAELALENLGKVLELLGAGAKTAAGYGRMKESRVAYDDLYKVIDAEIREQKAEELAALDPLERQIQEVLQGGPGDVPEHTLLYRTLVEEDRWSGSEAVAVALRLRNLMEAADCWRPTTQKRRPDRDTRYQRTLKVLEILDTAESQAKEPD